MIIVFVLFETYLSVDSGVNPHDYQFVYSQVYIYIFFLMLVNFGLDRVTFYKVINYAFYFGLFIGFISFIGYLGFFSMSLEGNTDRNLIKGSFVGSAKVSHVLQVNRVSYMFVFTILLLIVKQLKEKAFSPVYLFRDFTVILFLIGMISVNASRGAILIAVIFVLYYLRFLWQHWVADKAGKMLVISSLFLCSALFLYNIHNYFKIHTLQDSQITIVVRFHKFKAYTGTRIINIRNTWENFKEHPLTGVGYYNAAKRYNTGTRSNNQYLQLLASSGIIFFAIYILFHFKFYAIRLSLFKIPEVALSVFLLVALLVFSRPMEFFAVLGYIAYYFYYNYDFKCKSPQKLSTKPEHSLEFHKSSKI
jgi:hypothetical protein